MAGGYKHAKYTWVGGTVGSTDAERCATVLKGCAQALLDTGAGWSLDTSMNATLDDYTSIDGDAYYNTSTYSKTASPCYLLFFTSTSGAKLCLGYRYGYITKSTGYSSYGSRNAIPDSSQIGAYTLGLIASIIPPTSSQTFSKTSPYIPDDATRFCSPAHVTSMSDYSTTSRAFSFAASNASYATYEYHLITNGTNLIILNHSNQTAESSSLSYPNNYGGCVIGQVISSVTNDGDDYKFGTIPLANSATEHGSSDNNYNCSEARIEYGINTEGSYFSGAYSYSNNMNRAQSVRKADGSGWLTGPYPNAGTSGSSTLYGPRITAETYNFNTGISARNRWVPIFVYGMATAATLSEYGVTSETCLKGYADPDLIRMVNCNSVYQRGQTFDNGNIVYIGGGVAIGWDASNTTSIF